MYRKNSKPNVNPVLLSLSAMLTLIFFSACSGTRGDDHSSLPPPLYSQPKYVVANPNGGYSNNTITGEPVKPLIDSEGDTLPTGVPIPISTPESFVPKTKKVPFDRSKLSVEKAYPNTFQLSKNQKVVPLNTSNQIVVPFSLGESLPAIGDSVPASFSSVNPALPLRFKSGAVTNLQYLDVDQGLNLSQVSSLMLDKAGNIWIGMINGGVSRYDGLSFTHFSEKEGLKALSVWSMLEDRNGHIWFGTNVGIVRFDGTSFIHYPQTNSIRNNNLIWSIVEDTKGHLWFGTLEMGLIRFDGDAFTYFNDVELFRNHSIYSMILDQNGNLWIASDKGAILYDGTNFTLFTESEGLSTNKIISILEDQSGDIWLGTIGGGLIQFDGIKFTHFTEKDGLIGSSINNLYEDKSGHLWIVTEMGLFQFDGTTFTRFTEKEGLSSNLINSIIEDTQGNLWIGTYGGGINRLVIDSFKYFTQKDGLKGSITYALSLGQNENLWFGSQGGLNLFDGKSFTQITEKEGLNGTDGYSIARDRKGTIWIGTEKGLNTFDGKSFTHFLQDEVFQDIYPRTIMEDSKGYIWVGSVSGVFRFDGNSVTRFSVEEGFAANSISSIVEDRRGNLWFGSGWGGLSRFDGKTITHFSEKEGLSENKVVDMYVDRSGNLWIGTYGGGISRYDGNYFTHFTKKEGLSNDHIMSIIEDPKGRIWISTERGLNLLSTNTSAMDTENEGEYTQENYSIVQFKRNDGLIGLDFGSQAKLIDNENRLWWNHVTGVTTLDLNTFELSNNVPFVRLSQLDINERHIEYRNFGDSLTSDISFDSVQAFENYPLGLSLPHDYNHLTFYVTASDWSAPHKIQFSFKMDGLDEAWSKPTSETKIEYRNLPDGKYTLKISAIGQSNVWSEPFEYTFIVRPPWWATWWAYSLYASFLVVMIYGYIRRRTKLLEQENTLLEEKVMHRTAELEQSLENLKSTQTQLIHAEKMASLGELTAGIAHEIQNPLNFVNNFSELSSELVDEMVEELEQGETEEAKAIGSDIKSNLEKINHHGKRADAIVKGMLAHSRTGKGEKELTDINQLADEYLRLSYHGLRAKDPSFNADFKTDFDPNLPKVNVISQDIGRVLLNLINNAFQACAESDRSTRAERSREAPLVTISTKLIANPPRRTGIQQPTANSEQLTANSQLLIAIKDNGPGIPDTIKDKIFQPFFTTKPTGQGTGLGLSLSYDIIKAHSGNITVESSPELGTTFTIHLPITLAS